MGGAEILGVFSSWGAHSFQEQKLAGTLRCWARAHWVF